MCVCVCVCERLCVQVGLEGREGKRGEEEGVCVCGEGGGGGGLQEQSEKMIGGASCLYETR